MSGDEADEGFYYPTVDDILLIHEEIVKEDPNAEPGVENPDRIQYVVDAIEHGHFDEKPSTIHEKAFTLMRLIAANHWFVDGNKRTALNTVEMFYLFNDYRFNYGEDLRAMLKLLSVREDLIDPAVAVEFFAEKTERSFFLDSAEFERLLSGLSPDDRN